LKVCKRRVERHLSIEWANTWCSLDVVPHDPARAKKGLEAVTMLPMWGGIKITQCHLLTRWRLLEDMKVHLAVR
jgi:hypothetical protein